MCLASIVRTASPLPFKRTRTSRRCQASSSALPRIWRVSGLNVVDCSLTWVISALRAAVRRPHRRLNRNARLYKIAHPLWKNLSLGNYGNSKEPTTYFPTSGTTIPPPLSLPLCQRNPQHPQRTPRPTTSSSDWFHGGDLLQR